MISRAGSWIHFAVLVGTLGCASPPEPYQGEVTGQVLGHACPACPHAILRAEVVCAGCGQLMRHEERRNVGGRR